MKKNGGESKNRPYFCAFLLPRAGYNTYQLLSAPHDFGLFEIRSGFEQRTSAQEEILGAQRHLPASIVTTKSAKAVEVYR